MRAGMNNNNYDLSNLFGDVHCADLVESMLEWLDFDMDQDRIEARRLRRAFNRRRRRNVSFEFDFTGIPPLPPPPVLQRQVACDFSQTRGNGSRDDPIDLSSD